LRTGAEDGDRGVLGQRPVSVLRSAGTRSGSSRDKDAIVRGQDEQRRPPGPATGRTDPRTRRAVPRRGSPAHARAADRGKLGMSASCGSSSTLLDPRATIRFRTVGCAVQVRRRTPRGTELIKCGIWSWVGRQWPGPGAALTILITPCSWKAWPPARGRARFQGSWGLGRVCRCMTRRA
jgi:hypothetical protein